jgi:hypothetical protein
MRILQSAMALLQGSPFGAVYPPRPSPSTPTVDGRTVALSILKKYITELIFHLPVDNVSATYPGQTKEFRICDNAIFTEAADTSDIAVMPAIAFLPGRGTYDQIGLTSYLEEASRDRYGKGSVLQWQSEWHEIFTLQVWAPTKVYRATIVAGLETSLTPTEYMYGIRFKMPDYWDEMVCFTLGARTNIDDDMSMKGKWRANLEIEMRFNVVALVNYELSKPILSVFADSAP